MQRLLGIIIIAWVGAAGTAPAQEAPASSLLPVVPKALGNPHPEGDLFMRINHMKLLVHDRDETVHFGNRDIKYSLKQCIACHVVAGPDAAPVSAENENHFCRACHDYAAVKIDCFQCHNSRPDPNIQTLLLGRVPDPDELARYIEGLSE